MKKIYSNILFIFALLISSVKISQAQCNIAAPVISGNTLSCSGNGTTFTLTATTPNSLTTGWYPLPEGGNAISISTVFTTPVITTGATYYVGQYTSVSNQSITQPSHVTTILAMSRGFWFVAPVSFNIIGLRVPTDASPGIASVAVVKFNTTPPTYPTVTNSFTTLFLEQLSTSGTNTINVNIPVYAGDIIGVLGDRDDYSSYSPNPYNGTLGANPITLTRLGMLFNLSTNVPQDLWTESINNISRVEVYTSIGCLSTLTPVSVTVSTPPQITISGPPSGVCAGSSTTLVAAGADSYTWTAGPTTDSNTILASTTANYTVTGVNQAGCSNTAIFPLTVNPQPTITITPSHSIVCIGNTETLSLSGANTYTWNSGFNSPNIFITPVVTTTYGASGTDVNGCIGSTTINLGVSPLPTVNISATPSVVCAGQSATLSSSAADSYSWGIGQTTKDIVVTPAGVSNYVVTVKNAAGCSKTSSPFILITAACVGIGENVLSDPTLNVFPNPTNSNLTFRSGDPIRKLLFKDISGRVVLEQTYDLVTDLTLSLDHLSSGVYMVEIQGNQSNKIVKIVKD